MTLEIDILELKIFNEEENIPITLNTNVTNLMTIKPVTPFTPFTPDTFSALKEGLNENEVILQNIFQDFDSRQLNSEQRDQIIRR